MIDFRQSLHFARRKASVFGLFAVCCCIAWAQPGGPGGPPPDGPPMGGMQQISRGPNVERELKLLTKLLTLTAEQQTQVKAILTDQRQQIDALFKPASKSASESASKEEQPNSLESSATTRASIKAIREAAQSKIAGVLSDGQKTAFALWEKKQERAAAQEESEDMPPPPPDGGDGPPPDGGGGPGGGGPPGI